MEWRPACIRLLRTNPSARPSGPCCMEVGDEMAISAILMMTALASSGSCPGTFEQVAEATEDNYAGYIVKLPDDDARNVYRRFRGMMANTAATAMDHAA